MAVRGAVHGVCLGPYSLAFSAGIAKTVRSQRAARLPALYLTHGITAHKEDSHPMLMACIFPLGIDGLLFYSIWPSVLH
jgi:hypothetical protein